jgi:UDP-glucuronate decarboxylase
MTSGEPGGGAKRVLVTGGTGFLGSHLCDRLVADGCYVVAVSSSPPRPGGNLSQLGAHPRFELMRHDVISPLYIDVDEVYNLAAPASLVDSLKNPIRTSKTIVLGAINMLGLARRTGARVLQASTAEVYGEPLEHPQREDYWGNVNPIGVRSCYEEGKRYAESLFFDYRRQYDLPVKVVRIFNTYGPRMRADDGRVVSHFITEALAGKDITIYGDGSQTRSFCYVDDLIDGLVRMMATLSDVTGPVNLGSLREVTMLELATTVIDLTGSRSRIVFEPASPDDSTHRRPDTTLAQEVLGWKETTPLEEGLARTIEHFRDAWRSGADGRPDVGIVDGPA